MLGIAYDSFRSKKYIFSLSPLIPGGWEIKSTGTDRTPRSGSSVPICFLFLIFRQVHNIHFRSFYCIFFFAAAFVLYACIMLHPVSFFTYPFKIYNIALILHFLKYPAFAGNSCGGLNRPRLKRHGEIILLYSQCNNYHILHCYNDRSTQIQPLKVRFPCLFPFSSIRRFSFLIFQK